MGDRPTSVDDQDVVGELIGFFEVLRREEQCRAVRDEITDHVPQVESMLVMFDVVVAPFPLPLPMNFRWYKAHSNKS